MKVAVTGASGFIGRHVLDALTTMGGHEIMACRRAGDLPTSPHPSETWMALDIHAPPARAFDALGCPDVVIHLAWHGLPNYQSPEHVNVELVHQTAFLRALVEAGLKRLVVTGTCFEYGLQTECLSEESVPQPVTVYGEAKQQLHKALMEVQVRDGFDLRWLRLFYLYGPGQNPNALYASLSAAVARGDKSFDMSPGDQTRDFLDVREAAHLIAKLSILEQCPPVLNVCSGQPIAVKDIVRRWLDQMGADMDLNLGAFEYPGYEPMSFWGDASLLQKTISSDPL